MKNQLMSTLRQMTQTSHAATLLLAALLAIVNPAAAQVPTAQVDKDLVRH